MEDLLKWAKNQDFHSFKVHQFQRFEGGRKTGVFVWEATYFMDARDKFEERVTSFESFQDLKDKLMGTKPKKKRSGLL